MKSTLKSPPKHLTFLPFFAAKFKFSFLRNKINVYNLPLKPEFFKYTPLNVNQCITHCLPPRGERLKAMFKHFLNVMHCWGSLDPNYTLCPTFGALRFFISSSFLILEAAVCQNLRVCCSRACQQSCTATVSFPACYW